MWPQLGVFIAVRLCIFPAFRFYHSLLLHVLQPSWQTNLTNPIMYLSHIPQCTIQNRNVHISVLNGVLWDMGQVHHGICETIMHLSHIPQCTIQNRNVYISVLNGVLWDMGQVHCGICETGLFACCYDWESASGLLVVPYCFAVYSEFFRNKESSCPYFDQPIIQLAISSNWRSCLLSHRQGRFKWHAPSQFQEIIENAKICLCFPRWMEYHKG